MAGTMKPHGLKEILRTGLDNYQVSFRALRENNSLITDTVKSFNDAVNRSVSLPQVVLTIPGGETVKKLEITGEGDVLWDLDVDYEFQIEGTLTVNLSISLPATSPFTAAGLTFILGKGLRNRSVTVGFTSNDAPPVLASGSFGTESDNVIDLSGSITGNVTNPGTYNAFEVQAGGIGNILRVEGLNYVFETTGTLSLTQLQITLSD